MLVVNAGVGFWQEFKADNAIALLKQRLAHLRAVVSRLVSIEERPQRDRRTGYLAQVEGRIDYG